MMFNNENVIKTTELNEFIKIFVTFTDIYYVHIKYIREHHKC